MTDRAAQLRAASARSRKAKRAQGLRPHEHWYRDSEAMAVADFFYALAAARVPAADGSDLTWAVADFFQALAAARAATDQQEPR